MTKIFVIIVTFNGKIWYDRCFNSLKHSIIPIEIIVVDNASSDDTVNYIQKNYPEINLIRSEINLGFGQGNNKGIRYALDSGADYIFLLNQDAWIEPNTISELVRIQQQNIGYGILSPINLSVTKKSILDGFLELLANYHNVDLNWINDLYFNCLRDVYEIKSVNAAAWLLSRQILETVGGFDPIFFHYGEDDNYLQRAHYHHFKVGICPRISIVHDAEVSQLYNMHLKINIYQRLVLMICADINNDQMPELYAKDRIKKIFKSLIMFKIKTLKQASNELSYYYRMKNRIIYSRTCNKQPAANWLS